MTEIQTEKIPTDAVEEFVTIKINKTKLKKIALLGGAITIGAVAASVLLKADEMIDIETDPETGSITISEADND